MLDECDKLLEQLDMRRVVQRIFRATPHEKQVMMFSATLSDEVRPVCKKFMHNPHEIYVNEGVKLTLHGLQQYYVQLVTFFFLFIIKPPCRFSKSTKQNQNKNHYKLTTIFLFFFFFKKKKI